MATTSPLTFATVPAILTDEDRKFGSVGVHHWKTSQIPARVGLHVFVPTLVDAYLKALTAEEAKALTARTHFAYGRTWVEDEESHIMIRTVSFADLTDRRYAQTLRHRSDAYVPFIIYLGPTWHHFGFLRQMLAARRVYPVFVPPRLVMDPTRGPYLTGGYEESGPYLFARDQYTDESSQSIAQSEADGVHVFRVTIGQQLLPFRPRIEAALTAVLLRSLARYVLVSV